MKNEIEKNILEVNNLSVKKKTSVLPLALLITAAIIFAVSLCIGSEATKMPIMFIAIILGISGIAKLMATPKVLVHNLNNEELKEEELYFDSNDKSTVMQLLKSGNIRHLRALAKDNSNYPIMVELHSGVSECFMLYRIYHYVPYNYEPLTEYEVYKRP